MDAGSTTIVTRATGASQWSCPELDAPAFPTEPLTRAEIAALVHSGENEADACEWLLANSARVEAALELAIGEGLAALTIGERLISLGFSSLGDYARELLGIRERKAQGMAKLAQDLRERPLLRAAVHAGEVRIRSAQTVVPVARRDAEAEWVERARYETVRALEAAVEEARGASEDDEAWVRLHVRLEPEERAVVDEALEIAARLVPGSTRAQRLELLAQEYLGSHPVEVGSDRAPDIGAFRQDGARRARDDAWRARLEDQTGLWSYLPLVAGVHARDAGFGRLSSATAIDARLRVLAVKRDGWDAILGYAARLVKQSGLHQLAGFASFSHYCTERLGLAARTVERRAPSSGGPRSRSGSGSGPSCERLATRASRTRSCAPSLGCRTESSRAGSRRRWGSRASRSAMPSRRRTTRRCVRRGSSAGACPAGSRSCSPRPSGRCARDHGRCQVPGCSRRATLHAHHIRPRARGGSDDPANQVALCVVHHLRGIHGGYLQVRGTAPGGLSWEVGGRPFSARPEDPCFAERGPSERA